MGKVHVLYTKNKKLNAQRTLITQVQFLIENFMKENQKAFFFY